MPTSVSRRQIISTLFRDPMQALVDAGNRSAGKIVRLNLGTFRPYLVTKPDHLQHILRDNVANYVRDGKGLLWRQVRRAVGDGVLITEGPLWESSRDALHPLLAKPRVDSVAEEMQRAISGAVDSFQDAAQTGSPVAVDDLLTRIVCTATMRVLFGDRISVPDALRIVQAQGTIATAMVPRFVVPFMPAAVPMPGDRPFDAAVRTIDSIVYPVIRAARQNPGDGEDVVSVLSRPRTLNGRELPERQIRDDVAAMLSTSTETTIAVLSWLWPVLHRNPHVSERLTGEIRAIVGTGPVRHSHIGEMRYTRMVIDELLRLFPTGWMIPRTAVADEVVDGTRIRANSTVLVSPYATQRLDSLWERPDEFDPDRFGPEPVTGARRRRHRFAFFPFGGGPHQCLGQTLFLMEAPLILATLLSRFRIRSVGPADLTPRLGASLRPKSPARVTLHPVAQ
jgi:cytochrome P450